MSTTITPQRGPYGPRIFDANGVEVDPSLNKWARKDSQGWMIPPEEIQPMLDILNPQLLWAPVQQEFQIQMVGPRSGFRIYIKPNATVPEWKQMLSFLADWVAFKKTVTCVDR